MDLEEAKMLLEHVNDELSPELKKMVLIEWGGWLIAIVTLSIVLLVVWKHRDTICERCDGVPVGHVVAIFGGVICGIFVLCFIPYSIKVFTVPELEAVRSLFRG